MSLVRWESRRCARPFACEECKGEVSAGDDYQRLFQVDADFGAVQVKLCDRCAEMRHLGWRAFAWNEDCAPGIGELRAWLIAEGAVADPDAWLDEHLAAQAETAEAQP